MKKYFSIPLILVLFLGCPSETLDEDNNQSEPNNEIIERNNWCDGALGGSAHTRTVAAGLGRAHVGHRLFGALSDWLAADVSLSSMLESVTAYDRDLLKAYAEAFPTVCALEVVERANDETQMKIENGRAVIQPGTTIPELPEDVEEILHISLLGVIPEIQAVLNASNKGVPVIFDEQSDAGMAYNDTVERLLGEQVDFRFLNEQKKGIFKRLFGG